MGGSGIKKYVCLLYRAGRLLKRLSVGLARSNLSSV